MIQIMYITQGLIPSSKVSERSFQFCGRSDPSAEGQGKSGVKRAAKVAKEQGTRKKFKAAPAEPQTHEQVSTADLAGDARESSHAGPEVENADVVDPWVFLCFIFRISDALSISWRRYSLI